MRTRPFIQIAICITVLLASAPIHSARAGTIHAATVNWPPYAASYLPNNGFTTEIITEAFRRTGYDVQISFLPWKRALLLAEQGKMDAVFSAYDSKERREKFIFSDPYVISQTVFCARKDSEIEYAGLEGLKPYRIGVVRSYVNSPEFDAADFLHKEVGNSDIMNLKKLLAGRLDLIVIDKFTAIYLLKNDPTILGDINSVRFLSPPLLYNPTHILFSKKLDKHEEYVKAFNEGLQRMIDDGTYEHIMTTYGFTKEEFN